MTSKTLSSEQTKTLDFQTDHLYESFKRTIETQCHQDAIWNKELFTTFAKSLSIATNYSNFMNWNRDTIRTPIFDKYLLHYALGNIPSMILEEQILQRQFGLAYEAKKTNVTLDILKEAINNTRMPYKKIQPIALSLANAKNFTGIVNALEYVREKYHIPIE
jgi:hypothetical protein